MKKADTDFGIMCVCAERYALGRRTYMPGIVQDFIKHNINDIGNKDLDVLIRDIKEAEHMGGYGDENIDKPGWMMLLMVLKLEQKKRSGEIE